MQNIEDIPKSFINGNHIIFPPIKFINSVSVESKSIKLPPIKFINSISVESETVKIPPIKSTILVTKTEINEKKCHISRSFHEKHKNIYICILNKWMEIKHLLNPDLINNKEFIINLKIRYSKQSLILLIHIAIALNGITNYTINNNLIEKFRVSNNNKIFINLIYEYFPKYKNLKNTRQQFMNYGMKPYIDSPRKKQPLPWCKAFAGEIDFIVKSK